MALDVIESHFYFYGSVNCTKGLRAIPLASFSMPSSSSRLVVETAQRSTRGLNLPIDPVQWIRALSRASIRNVLTSFTLVSSPLACFLNARNTSLRAFHSVSAIIKLIFLAMKYIRKNYFLKNYYFF